MLDGRARFMVVRADASESRMIPLRESLKSLSISFMIVGFLLLFFSFAFIIVFPESEHTAFPYPLGIPGIAAIVIGLFMYMLSKSSNDKEKKLTPPS